MSLEQMNNARNDPVRINPIEKKGEGEGVERESKYAQDKRVVKEAKTYLFALKSRMTCKNRL